MESDQANKKTQDDVYDLGNFSDFDEHDDQDACGGDNNHKSKKDPSKKPQTCSTDENKTCGTDCQNKQEEKPQIDAAKLCRKCKEKKGTLRYRSEPVCKDCYLSGLEHRFRATLRLQCKLAKKDDEVLCCLSGGQNSLALCKMISESLYNPGPRKMFFKAQAIHINPASVLPASEEEEKENVTKMVKFAEKYKLQLTIINIEDVFDLQSEYLDDLLANSYQTTFNKDKKIQTLTKEEKREKLQKLLSSLSDTGSAKDDLVFIFKKVLIADYAAKNGLTKLLFGDTAQQVAINSLTLLCKGRGADIFNQVAPEEKTFGNVTIYRPMNDFLTKEILVYDHFNKLDEYFIIYPKLEDLSQSNKKLPGNGSINTLLEGFVDKLQAGFPSTVHTVLNTLNKIKPKYNETKICPVCWGRKDKLGNILEKGSIIQYLKPQNQQEITEEYKNSFLDMDSESKKIKADYLNSDYFQSKSQIERTACFSCGRIFENAKNQAELCQSLPEYVQISAQNICDKILPKEISQAAAFDYYFYDDDDL